jgi:hypothetical protein
MVTPPSPEPLGGIGLMMPAEPVRTAMLILLAALVVAYALLFWAIRRSMRGHMTVRCPETGETAVIRAAIGPEGEPRDVLECSLLPAGRPIACGKHCIPHPAG